MNLQAQRRYMREYMRRYRARGGRRLPRVEVSPPGHCGRCGLEDRGRDLCRYCRAELARAAA